MRFNLLCEDEAFINALKKFYFKHYKNEIDLQFNSDDFSCIVICEKKNMMNDNTIILSDKNQIMTKEINQYQSGHYWMKYLISIREEDMMGNLPFRTYGFFNVINGAGATTLSLNLAQKLSKRGKTVWLSLERVPSTMFFLDKKSGFSLTDVMFYLKQDSKLLIERLTEWHSDTFYWFDQCELFEDLQNMNLKMLTDLILLLKKAGFSNVVIDFDNEVEWFREVNLSLKLACINESLNSYYRLNQFPNMLDKEVQLIINRQKDKPYISQAYLNIIEQYIFLDYDNNLEEERLWSSTTIQQTLMKDLKLI